MRKESVHSSSLELATLNPMAMPPTRGSPPPKCAAISSSSFSSSSCFLSSIIFFPLVTIVAGVLITMQVLSSPLSMEELGPELRYQGYLQRKHQVKQRNEKCQYFCSSPSPLCPGSGHVDILQMIVISLVSLITS